MDHPFSYTWALAPQSMGSFRGPIQTSGIETLRDGDFRSRLRRLPHRRRQRGLGHRQLSAERRRRPTRSAKNVFGRSCATSSPTTLPRQIRIGFDIEQLPEWKNCVDDRPDVQGRAGVLPPDPQVRRQRLHLAGDGRGDEGLQGGVRRARHPEADQHFYGRIDGVADAKHYTAPDGKRYLLNFIGAGHHIGTHRMGTTKHEQRREQRSAQLGPRESLRRRLRQLPDHGDGQPDAHGDRPRAALDEGHAHAAPLMKTTPPTRR